MLLALLVVPASATITNTTQFGASSAGTYRTDSVSPGQSKYYNPSTDLGDKYIIIQTTYKLTNDDSTLHTFYTTKTGTTIEVDTTSVTTGIFSAEYHVTNSNGVTAIIPYTMWIPWSGSNAPNLQTRILYGNQTGQWYLYTGLQSDTGNPLDAATASFAVIDSPATNPIASVMQTVVSGGTLEATYLSIPNEEVNYDAAKTIEAAQNGGVTTSWAEKLTQILDYIVKAIMDLGVIVKSASGFLSITTAFFVFLTAAEVFFGLSAVYVAIAIILSIADSDDMFKSVGKFKRYMMALFRFYMELFRAVKDIIKWW